MRLRVFMVVAMTATLLWPDTVRPEPPDSPPPRPFGKFIFHGRGGPGGPGFPVFGEGPGPMLPLVLSHANLTPEQRTKVERIIKSERQNLSALFKQVSDANDGLAEKIFGTTDVKLADLQPQIDQINDARRQLMEQGVKTTLAIRSVLTPEQITKVSDLKRRIDKLQEEMRQLMMPMDLPME